MQLLREVKEFRATYNRVFNLCKLVTGENKEEREYFSKYGKRIKEENTALYRYINNPEKFKKLTNQYGKLARESKQVYELLFNYSDDKFEAIKDSRRLTLLLVYLYTQTQAKKKHYNLFPEISFFRGHQLRDIKGDWMVKIYKLCEEDNKDAIRFINTHENVVDSLPYIEDAISEAGNKWNDKVVKYVEDTIKSWWDKSKLEPEAKPLTLQEALDKIARLEKKLEEVKKERDELRQQLAN